MKRADLLREIATMVDAGVSLHDGLRKLSSNLPRPWKKMALRWSEELSQGQPLCRAMAVVPPGLSNGDYALIEAAEASGRLGPCLQTLAQSSEAYERRKSKLHTGLIYPVLLFHGAAVIPAFLTYAQSGLFPALLMVLIILIPAYLFAGFFGWMLWHWDHQSGPWWVDSVLGRIPFLGKGLRQAATARFCGILSGLLDSGVRVETALESAALASGDRRLGRRIIGQIALLESGAGISDVLSSARILDDITLSIVQSGEISGSITSSLDRAAEKCDFEAHQSLDRLAILAPMACYFLAVLIAVAQIFRMLAPLFSVFDEVLK